MPVIRRSSRKTAKHSSKRKPSKTKRSKKNNPSRKRKILRGGAEHINEPSPEMKKRMAERKKLLQVPMQMGVSPQAPPQVQQPIALPSSSSNIMNKLQSVLGRK